MNRTEVLRRIQERLERPVRWATPLVAYDGCERTGVFAQTSW